MDLISTGSQITKKNVDIWALKPIEVNLINKSVEIEEDKKEEKKENTQLSFDTFNIEDFKI